VPEVLELGYRVLEYLLHENIGVAFLTKGAIPGQHFDLLRAHASLVRAQVGIISLAPEITQRFEPFAAAPDVRVDQVRRLIAAGVETHARLDPILPGVTDDCEGLRSLLVELAGCGVKHVAASALFLRPAIMRRIKRELAGTSYLAPVLEPFSQGRRMGIHAERSAVWALPAVVREAVYARVRVLARECHISVHVCGCKNPDLSEGSCHIAGRWGSMQRALFGEEE
jgi:DNA repair photolyase